MCDQNFTTKRKLKTFKCFPLTENVSQWCFKGCYGILNSVHQDTTKNPNFLLKKVMAKNPAKYGVDLPAANVKFLFFNFVLYYENIVVETVEHRLGCIV